MHHQVQSLGTSPPRSAHVHRVRVDVDVETEIQDFLQAVNSYPARVAKEPGVTFWQHLSSISAARHDNESGEEGRGGSRPRRQ
jgi:hypothetical protein